MRVPPWWPGQEPYRVSGRQAGTPSFACCNPRMKIRHDAEGHRPPAIHPGVPRSGYEDERGQFIEEHGERIDGVWLLPEEHQADTPVIVDLRTA